jgi:squalene-hopene/tetraprenyl-beta-curcumene cyclase
MTTRKLGVYLLLMLCFGLLRSIATATEISTGAQGPKSDISLKLEVQHAIERGLSWLAKSQQPGGFWSSPEHPALTGLVLTGFMGEPTGGTRSNPPDFILNGYKYLFNNIKPDGGIYAKDLPNYNTSVSMMALMAAYNPSFEPHIRRARNFVVGLQSDFDEKGSTDNSYDGGIGYGGSYQHSDMSNTMFALESIYYSTFMGKDKEITDIPMKELNWSAALKFIERSQNLPGYNDQAWASDDPQNKGGFIYFPGDSKAGEMVLPSGEKALRSYGSISYAGLLSYAYADLKRDDPRVSAVLEWLRKNYTLDENPGMGQEGLFYYYHTMAKALNAYEVNQLVLADGTTVDWRKELVLKLLDLQKPDGMWINDNGRWWEKDPNLVTAYSVIILEIIYKGL